MKKKILLAMMLCVCVFGLTGCNKPERTFEVAFKQEQKKEYEFFRDALIEDSYGMVTDVDVVDDEVLIISENSFYDAFINDEEIMESFNDPIFIEEMTEAMTGDVLILIEMFEQIVEDYDGNIVFRYIFKAPSGNELLNLAVDKNGLVE